jgi:methylglutaconyl-CoA hydratase
MPGDRRGTIEGMEHRIERARRGTTLVLTLNEPDRANPLSPAMAESLTAALVDARGDEQVRSVVLTGAGRHFSAGADLAALEAVAAGGSAEANEADSERLERLFSELLSHPKLTVAAVQGAAVAGGCGLATACDVVVAGPRARFAYTEVRIGFIPALVSTFLTRRVSGGTARRLLLDPHMLSAAQALEIGLVDDLAEEGREVEYALEVAERIARTASPAALAATKALLLDTVGLPWREALSHAARANAIQRVHPECRRGVRAFLETKSTPDWIEES